MTPNSAVSISRAYRKYVITDPSSTFGAYATPVTDADARP